jgi:mRNA-degrading endonuclease RelE of RelBE toxin-antitoxin system
MGFKILPTDKFKREAKRLARKYPSLKEELKELGNKLIEVPEYGKPLGNNTFKIRIGIKSKGKGKSGGGRVITYLVTEDQVVYLLLIYDKSEFDAIDDKTLQQLIERINLDKTGL